MNNTKIGKIANATFLNNFVLSKLTCLVTLFDRNLQVFKNSPKLTIFGIFHSKKKLERGSFTVFKNAVKKSHISKYLNVGAQKTITNNL